jgi:import receptor subunit TOM70
MVSDRQRVVAVVAGTAAVALGIGLLVRRWRRRANGAARAVPDAGALPASEPAAAAEGGEMSRHDQAKKAKDLGNKRFQGRQYAKAVEEYSRAIALAPDPSHKDVSVFYGNRAQAHAMLEMHAQAEADCDAAIAIDPRYVKAFCRRAVAREKQGNLQGAFADFTAATLLSGMTNEVANEGGERVLKSVALACAEARLAQPMHTLPSSTFISTFIDSFLSHRRLLAAPAPRSVAQLGKALESATGLERAKLLCERARCLMRASKYELALTDWLAACAMLPPPPSGDEWLDGLTPPQPAPPADAAELLAAWTAEAEAGGNAAFVSPAMALSMTGMFLHLRGNYGQAMSCYNYALSLQPKAVDVLLKRASLWYERDEHAKALADFETAVAIDPEDADIYCHRGQLHILQSELASALLDLRKAVALDAGSVLSRIQLGMTLHRSGQATEARKVFADAEKAFPKSADVLNYHGELLVEAQDYAAAKQKFSAALKASGDKYALAHVNMGVLQLHQSQDMEGGMRHCEKAIAVDPLCETAHVHLAHLKLQQFDLVGAVAAYDSAVALLRMKQELVDCYSMREATAAQLQLITAQPEIYEPLMAEHRKRAAAAMAAMG